MNIRPVFLFLALLAIASFTASAQTKPYTAADYDAVLTAVFPEDGPGATALISRKGEVVYHAAFGKANLEHQVEMRTDHIFRIGSITKQFTAAAILKLWEEGKLSLDDDITKFLPDYPTQGQKITVRHLLNHTSGIKSYTSLERWDAQEHRRDLTPLEMIDSFKDEPMDFAPGDEFRYNNSGYFILGYIIEQVTGQEYGTYVEETFFQPLGMAHSSYDRTQNILPNRANGYGAGESGYLNAPYLSMTQPYAAGSLLSTVADLHTWYQAVVAGKVISPESFALATSPTVLNNGKTENYGFGWSLSEIEGSPAFGHGGGIHGFLTASTFLPEEEVFVTVFSNCNCNNPNGVSNKLAAMAIGKYQPLVAVAVSDAWLEAYVGNYELMPDFFVMVSEKDDQLVVRATGQGEIPLTAVGDHQFANEAVGIKIRFNPGAEGEVPTFTLFQNGAEMEARRVDE